MSRASMPLGDRRHAADMARNRWVKAQVAERPSAADAITAAGELAFAAFKTGAPLRGNARAADALISIHTEVACAQRLYNEPAAVVARETARRQAAHEPRPASHTPHLDSLQAAAGA